MEGGLVEEPRYMEGGLVELVLWHIYSRCYDLPVNCALCPQEPNLLSADTLEAAVVPLKDSPRPGRGPRYRVQLSLSLATFQQHTVCQADIEW
jgi:hypothetical protein